MRRTGTGKRLSPRVACPRETEWRLGLRVACWRGAGGRLSPEVASRCGNSCEAGADSAFGRVCRCFANTCIAGDDSALPDGV